MGAYLPKIHDIHAFRGCQVFGTLKIRNRNSREQLNGNGNTIDTELYSCSITDTFGTDKSKLDGITYRIRTY